MPRSSAECFSMHTNRWNKLPPMPSRKAQCCAAVMNGSIYVAGGNDVFDEPSTSVYRLDLVSERLSRRRAEWRALPSMRHKRHRCFAAAARGSLYVMGGSDDSEMLSVVEVFREDMGRWQDGPRLPRALCAAGCAVVENRFACIAGGEDADGDGQTHVAALDVETQKWLRLPHLQWPRSCPAVGVVAGRLCAVGSSFKDLLMTGAKSEVGCSAEFLDLTGLAEECARISPSTMPWPNRERRWKWLPKLPQSLGRFSAAGVSVAGRLLVVGGLEPKDGGESYKPVASVLSLDVRKWFLLMDSKQPEWTELARMRAAEGGGRAACAAVAIECSGLPDVGVCVALGEERDEQLGDFDTASDLGEGEELINGEESGEEEDAELFEPDEEEDGS
eukprot:TRINITY_DN33918_c0_g1_i2.p1 TRINITY_DN33918_c0_g1~~TRINITY_DN33918_c0_g1_i2.p1  ORF type:complete len:389 (-),score=67.16 TRINITY_DN33918_c0_g1_i2:407-1573(-)